MGTAVQFRFRTQRGISLTGIVLMLVVLGSVFMLGMRIVPAVVEYQSIKNAVAKARATNGTPAQMRETFGKDASVNDITSIESKDLDITHVGNQNEIAFEYERRIPLVANATLLLTFAGSTEPNGKVDSKTAAADK